MLHVARTGFLFAAWTRTLPTMDFRAVVEPHMSMHGLEVPAEVVSALDAGPRPRVVVTINGHSWRTGIALVRGRHLIGLKNADRQAAGLTVGESVTVEVVVDTEPLPIDEPPELTAALAADPAARAAFEARTASQRRQHCREIDQAKGADTRARRVAKLLDFLHAQGRS